MRNDEPNSDVKTVIFWAISGIVSVLLVVNGYFLTRVIEKTDKIDKLTDQIWSLRQQVTILAYRMDEVQKKN